jgi:predicted transcriptional regulator
MRRAAPRIPVTERTQARVLFCHTLPRNQVLDVRLSDVSTTGIGFTTAHTLDAGDLLVVSVTLAGRPVDVETRVVRVDPAPYGRIRVGGEITELSEANRRIIADMAMRTPEAGSEAERRNGAAAGTPATR